MGNHFIKVLSIDLLVTSSDSTRLPMATSYSKLIVDQSMIILLHVQLMFVKSPIQYYIDMKKVKYRKTKVNSGFQLTLR